MPRVSEMEIKDYFPGSPVHLGRHEGKRYIVLQEGESRYIFNFMNSYLRRNFAEVRILVLIVLLSAILACAYFVIRWILRPVTRLSEGVLQVGAGNLDYRVPAGGRDELGRLAAAFNAMTGRIKAMLASREQLLLDVSHELRSPVTRMKVALEFIPETNAKKSIREDLSEMEAMITELLETHRLGSEHGRLELQEADLAALAGQVAEGFSHREPGVNVSPPAGRWPVRIDPRRIKIVLDNILENALKYSQGAGEPVRVYFEKTQSYSVVKIRDAGQGMPPEDLPNIFEPFYRVDRSRSKQTGGYGLGLSICKTIMEAHGGKIEAESAPGGGTTISLIFLRAEAE
jgi:signal transduction histidine kinase